MKNLQKRQDYVSPQMEIVSIENQGVLCSSVEFLGSTFMEGVNTTDFSFQP